MADDQSRERRTAGGLMRRSRLWLQLALTAVFIGVLAWRVDILDAFSTFTEVHYGWIVPAMLVFSLSKLIHSFRWQLLLRKTQEAPVLELFGIYLVSNMTNTSLPFRLGDVLRIQIPALRFNIPRAQLTASVLVVETVLDGFAFIVMVLLVLSFLGLPNVSTGLLWAFCAAGSVGFILVLITARFRPPERLAERRWMRIFSDDIRLWLARVVPQFLQGLEAMRDPRRMWKVIAISFPAWLLEAIVFWFFGMAYSLELAPHKYIVIMIAANLIVALPITPWNIGPFEVAVQEVVAAFGVDRSLAAGYAIGTHIFLIMWITFTGLISVWLLKLSLRDVLSLGIGRPANEKLPDGG